jgi:transcriptional adapter 2-alpha
MEERQRRKAFVLERGILDVKRGIVCRRKTREEREISNALKVFTRFNTQEDHELMVNSLIKERKLREIID